MKYRLDMVEKLSESPGMRSDRLGTTPNALPLESFSRASEYERESLRGYGADLRKKKETWTYKVMA